MHTQVCPLKKNMSLHRLCYGYAIDAHTSTSIEEKSSLHRLCYGDAIDAHTSTSEDMIETVL
jgi:hypothetical protein